MDMTQLVEQQSEELGDQREIAEAARAGDVRAWETLFTAHYPNLFRFFRSRVATVEDAEDLANDVFIEAYRSIERYNARKNAFGAWLFGIARHLVADHYRRHSRRGAELDVSQVGGDDYLPVEIEDLLRRLRPDHRAALELRFIVGLTGEEAAAIMGRSHGAFRVLLNRAAREFRRQSAPPGPIRKVRATPATES